MTSVGIPARPPVAKKPLVHMAEYSINAKKTGVLRDFSFLDKWTTHPDVLYAKPLAQARACMERGGGRRGGSYLDDGTTHPDAKPLVQALAWGGQGGAEAVGGGGRSGRRAPQ